MPIIRIHMVQLQVIPRSETQRAFADGGRGIISWVNPPSPNPVVTCKQSAAHMTYLKPTQVFFTVFLVLQYVLLL